MATAAPAVPAALAKLCRRFERWRKSHPGRLPIPEPLWASAVEAARRHGLFRTAQVLRLDYGKLKRLLAAATPAAGRSTPPPAFVELLAPPPTGLAECVIELEGPRGKIRVQWKGATAPDWAALSRTLWEPAP
jgi:hypothetical protein